MKPLGEIVEGLLAMPQTVKVYYTDQQPFRFGILTRTSPTRAKDRIPYHHFFGRVMERYPMLDIQYYVSGDAEELRRFAATGAGLKVHERGGKGSDP